MGIQITQTFAKIGVDRSPSKLVIESRNTKVELHQKQPMIKIHAELPKVKIDQSRAFSSAGIKSNGEIIKEAAENGYQQSLDCIGKTASDGDTLAAIENNVNAIVELAVSNSTVEHEFNIDSIPKVGPDITVTGSLKIDPGNTGDGIHNGVEANVIPGDVNVNYTPSKISLYIREKASLNIRFTGNKIDTYV